MGPTRTRRHLLTLTIACALAVSAALAGAGLAWSAGGSQQVRAAVQAQFGASIAADGSVTGNASTVGVSVTRQVVRGVSLVTIAPRE
jgi:hypothetical protein